jgi:hypothetical protein
LISIKYGRLLAPQQLRQLGDVHSDAPGLVPSEQLGRRASPRLVLRKEYALSP